AVAIALANPAAAQTAATTPQVASGIVTSLVGSTAQVENSAQNSEATVLFSTTTTYQKIETVATTAIKAGDCVRVTGTGTTTKGITATNITLSAPVSGSCTEPNPNGAGGFGGAGGTAGAGAFGNGQRPNFGNGQGPGGQGQAGGNGAPAGNGGTN